MRQNGTVYYLLSDHLGSTSITTDASGNKVSELKYRAWGEVRYSSGAPVTDYTFTGQYSNVDDFGLMYYGARWYDPSIAHFSQPDSIIPDQYNPLDWNRYSYARYNPIKFTDPSGHMPACEFPYECDQKFVQDKSPLIYKGGDFNEYKYMRVEISQRTLMIISLSVMSETSNSSYSVASMELIAWACMNQVAYDSTVNPYAFKIPGATNAIGDLNKGKMYTSSGNLGDVIDAVLPIFSAVDPEFQEALDIVIDVYEQWTSEAPDPTGGALYFSMQDDLTRTGSTGKPTEFNSFSSLATNLAKQYNNCNCSGIKSVEL